LCMFNERHELKGPDRPALRFDSMSKRDFENFEMNAPRVNSAGSNNRRSQATRRLKAPDGQRPVRDLTIGKHWGTKTARNNRGS
jgi:hypothetical protein